MERCGTSFVWRGGGQDGDDCQEWDKGWRAGILPGESGGISRYLTVSTVQHLMFVSLVDGRRSPLTLGTFTVTKILAWDMETGDV